MIERILPSAIAFAERIGEPRSRDFETGRECAREALVKLGVGVSIIARGGAGEPVWPEGIVGSLTHTHEYCAAAVARTSEVLKLGIDAEVHRALREGVLEIVADADELKMIRDLPKDVHWETVLFSAKESIYKAWFPSGGRLGWEDVSVVLQPGLGTFTTLKPAGIEGRFLVTESLIVTVAIAQRLPSSAEGWPRHQ
jgi:4'-phosphopantetheinyl transferase EntD